MICNLNNCLMVSENGTKVCSKCGKEKPVSEFSKDKNSSDGYTYQCKECRNKKYREYYAAHPEKRKEKNDKQKDLRKEYYSNPERKFAYRKRYIEREFGIKYEDYDKMLEEQHGVCAICGKPETKPNAKYLAVDHNHETGEVRGLLCNNCNRALGLLKDNVDVLQNAINYLKKHERSNSSV